MRKCITPAFRLKRETTPTTLTKREFMQQYVLNRAATVDSLSGDGAAEQAWKAWDTIERACHK